MPKFITIQWIPYEGQDVAWHNSEEEAVVYAKSRTNGWGKDDTVEVYEIARKIEIN